MIIFVNIFKASIKTSIGDGMTINRHGFIVRKCYLQNMYYDCCDVYICNGKSF